MPLADVRKILLSADAKPGEKIACFGLSQICKINWLKAGKADLSDADVIIIYLSHQALDRLEEKLRTETKPTARIITYRFLIRGWSVEKTDDDRNIFLYRPAKGSRTDKTA